MSSTSKQKVSKSDESVKICPRCGSESISSYDSDVGYGSTLCKDCGYGYRNLTGSGQLPFLIAKRSDLEKIRKKIKRSPLVK